MLYILYKNVGENHPMKKLSVLLTLLLLFATWNISNAVTYVTRTPQNFTNLSGYAWSTTTAKLGFVGYSRSSTTYPIDVTVTTSTSVSTTYNIAGSILFSAVSVQSITTSYTNANAIRWAIASTATINLDPRYAIFDGQSPFQPIGSLTSQSFPNGLLTRSTTVYNTDSSYLYIGFTAPPSDTSIRIILNTASKLPFGTFAYRSSLTWVPVSNTYTLSSATSVLVFTNFKGWSIDTIAGGIGHYWIQYTMSSCTSVIPVFQSIQANVISTTDTLSGDTAFAVLNPNTPINKTSLTVPNTNYFIGFSTIPSDTIVRIICKAPLSKLPTGTFSYRSSGSWIASGLTYTLASSTSLLAFTDLNAWSIDTIVAGQGGYFYLQYQMSTCTTSSPIISSIGGETTVQTLNLEYANLTKKADTTSSGFIVQPSTAGDTGHFYIGSTTQFNSFYVTLSQLNISPSVHNQWYYSISNAWKKLPIQPSIFSSSASLVELGTTLTDWARYSLSTAEDYDPSFYYKTLASQFLLSSDSSAFPLTGDTKLATSGNLTTTTILTSYLWIGYPTQYALSTVYLSHFSAWTGFRTTYSYLSAGNSYPSFAASGDSILSVVGVSTIAIPTLAGASTGSATTGWAALKWLRIGLIADTSACIFSNATVLSTAAASSGLFYIRMDTNPFNSANTTYTQSSVSLLRLFQAQTTSAANTCLFYSIATIYNASSVEFSLSTTTTYTLESTSDYPSYSIFTLSMAGYFAPYITQGISTIYFSRSSAQIVYARARGLDGSGNPISAWSALGNGYFIDTTLPNAPTTKYQYDTTNLIASVINSATTVFLNISWTKVNNVSIDSISVSTVSGVYNWIAVPSSNTSGDFSFNVAALGNMNVYCYSHDVCGVISRNSLDGIYIGGVK